MNIELIESATFLNEKLRNLMRSFVISSLFARNNGLIMDFKNLIRK